MNKYWVVLLLCVLGACTDSPVRDVPGLLPSSLVYPDYEGVTVPQDIAPLSFSINTPEKKVKTVLHTAAYSVSVGGREVSVPARKWKKLLASGDTVRVDILYKKGDEWMLYHSFPLYVSPDKIDPYITYRLIAPGYEVWNRMGIYQRCLSSYDESPVYENTNRTHFCVNCHTTNRGNPEEFIFHRRPGGTVLAKGGVVKKLNTQYNEKVHSLVYPSWHPSGHYIAFSVNKTVQGIHSQHPNRIEVWDEWSDIVILDVRTNSLITIPLLMSENSFETFPSFSPDGKRLYFCSARAVALPDSIKEVRYDLCSIQLDLDKNLYGRQVDTVIQASANNRSVSFPRLSPDGRFLLYTEHNYGNFSIWHREADLKMYDLVNKTPVDVGILNSTETESYHTWSSNGRWVIFSSRRGDGLYTRPYIAHIDTNGVAGKPFLLPQKNSTDYIYQDRSYNIPEFMTGRIENPEKELEDVVEKE
ncbi:TolB-like translocation protein [Parabacteroides pacaensis]|uniref:PD40 domain-containing protein n=1 Tax=Parabacteroides pacaensis TaxID=2086575 RepID=UPI00131AAFB7|nr:PD40 domain-containing protein [Parabacteroides pacaensis]